MLRPDQANGVAHARPSPVWALSLSRQARLRRASLHPRPQNQLYSGYFIPSLSYHIYWICPLSKWWSYIISINKRILILLGKFFKNSLIERSR